MAAGSVLGRMLTSYYSDRPTSTFRSDTLPTQQITVASYTTRPKSLRSHRGLDALKGHQLRPPPPPMTAASSPPPTTSSGFLNTAPNQHEGQSGSYNTVWI